MSDADEINAIRTELAGITGSPEALLFASIDFVAVQLAAMAQLDAELSDQQLDWAMSVLPTMVKERRAMFEAEQHKKQ